MNAPQQASERPAAEPQQQARTQADEALRRARAIQPRVATRRTMNDIRGV